VLCSSAPYLLPASWTWRLEVVVQSTCVLVPGGSQRNLSNTAVGERASRSNGGQNEVQARTRYRPSYSKRLPKTLSVANQGSLTVYSLSASLRLTCVPVHRTAVPSMCAWILSVDGPLRDKKKGGFLLIQWLKPPQLKWVGTKVVGPIPGTVRAPSVHLGHGRISGVAR
jgi:hypothetical protein